MRRPKIGSVISWDEASAMFQATSEPACSVPGVSVWPRLVAVDLTRSPRAEFNASWRVNRLRDDGAMRSRVLLNLDYDLKWPAQRTEEDWRGEVDVLLKRHDEMWLYLGRAEAQSFSLDVRVLKGVYRLVDELPPSLARELVPRQPNQPMDGPALGRALATRSADLPEQLASSWFGPLPSVPPPTSSSDAPPEIQAWHRLWTKLAALGDVPWTTWNPCWVPGDLSYFLDESQNLAMLGARRNGTVWAHFLEPEEEPVQYASSIAEFAIQFLVYAIVESTNGFFIESDLSIEDDIDLEPLPIAPWSRWFGEDEIRFVGAPGFLGLADENHVSLRATHSSSLVNLAASAG